MAGDSMLIVTSGLSETIKVLIRSKVAPLSLEFQTPKGNDDLRRLLNSRNIIVGCVLVDSDTQDDKGQSFCTSVRAINQNVPLIVLSSEKDKAYYVKAIRWGVSGFVVKPLGDDIIRAKLMDCYRTQSEKSAEMITFDLEKYLLGEFRKAEKGNFSLTFMFVTVRLDDPEEQGNAMSHAYYLNLLYETIKKLFWDTDAFIRYNSKYYLGVFPFCTKENVAILEGKMRAAFHGLYASRGMPQYVKLVSATSTYPNDGTRFLDVQRVLSDRARLLMGDTRFEWYI